jgi:CDP-glycerol glycerophosphotransferase
MRLVRIPGARQVPSLLRRVEPATILFESWQGAYSDNPRAISEELMRRGAPYRHVWVLNGQAGDEVPAEVTRVRPGTRAYLEALGSARYIVANNTLPGYFHKKPQTTYLQTWHGTPLKRIAFDIPAPTFSGSRKYVRHLRRDVGRWDYLIAPNAFSADVFRQAFHYGGRMLETGYPRNDVLLSPERESVRAALRRRLEIPDGARAVLYAPTWRDNDVYSSELDLPAVADALPDCFLLLRAHQLVAATVAKVGHPRIRNVSQHADVRDLYLAADVLVTDYSSVMFDFAVTRKPILLFTYDLAHYRDELRGLYLPLEQEAPGPLLTTTAEVIDALHDLDALAQSHADAYARFAERFCGLEDGHAAERVVDAVFGP